MKKIIFLFIFIFPVVVLSAQVAAPKKNGHYELKNKRQVIESGECTNGFKTGTWSYFSEYGTKQREEDYDRNGFLLRTRQYARTSVFTEQYTLINGVYSGEYKLFSEYSSFISVRGWYKNGQRDSTWNYYRMINGKSDRWKTEMWDKGKCHEINTFYPGDMLFKTELLNESDSIASRVYYDKNGVKMNKPGWVSQRDSLVHDSIMKLYGGKEYPDTVKKILFDERMPYYIGQEGLLGFLRYNINYPIEAKEAGRSGTVYISFVVNTYGDIEKVMVARSSGNKYLDEEAMRVTKMMPPWHPASLGSRYVQVEMKQPVRFVLQ
jgi:TonB family protein